LVLAAAICGFAIFVFFRKMPTKWLLDYDENEISSELIAQQNLPVLPYAVITTISSIIIAWILIEQAGGIFHSISIFVASMPLLLIILADHRTRIIPDQFIIVLLICGIILWLSENPRIDTLLIRFASGLGGGLLLAFAGWAGSKLMKQEAMGMGDVKLLAASGFAAGMPGILLVIIISFVAAAFPAIFLLLRSRNREEKGSLPFGPYISASLIAVLLFEDKLLSAWQWWLNSASFY
jgi:leader peptidase (prepilin peptidase)/N-methyltransferase